jgi:hypothetical protein
VPQGGAAAHDLPHPATAFVCRSYSTGKSYQNFMDPVPRAAGVPTTPRITCTSSFPGRPPRKVVAVATTNKNLIIAQIIWREGSKPNLQKARVRSRAFPLISLFRT